MSIPFHTDMLYFELDEFVNDEELIQCVRSCVEAQWEAGRRNISMFRKSPESDIAVSEGALAHILSVGKDISDIRTHQELSNCIVFHTRNLDGTLIDEEVLALRSRADDLVADRLRRLFSTDHELHIEMSGHFWYPSGGFMGWHTNLRKPGWRMYVNYVAEEGKSFFRFRDPISGKIITSWDKQWNFRLFRISPEFPFWHCVRSETDRFSLGYKITTAET